VEAASRGLPIPACAHLAGIHPETLRRWLALGRAELIENPVSQMHWAHFARRFYEAKHQTLGNLFSELLKSKDDKVRMKALQIASSVYRETSPEDLQRVGPQVQVTVLADGSANVGGKILDAQTIREKARDQRVRALRSVNPTGDDDER